LSFLLYFKDQTMTPNEIEVLIHFHSSNAPHPRASANAVDGAIQSFLAAGLIIENPDIPNSYHTTNRGSAHVAQLCSLAWPKCKWIGSDGSVIEI